MIVVASAFVLGKSFTSIVNAGLKSVGLGWVWCGGVILGFVPFVLDLDAGCLEVKECGH